MVIILFMAFISYGTSLLLKQIRPLDSFKVQCYPDSHGISMTAPTHGNRFQIHQLSAQDSFELLKQDVQDGLFQAPRFLPPKYFYDAEGSALFDQICDTEDYYPTRTESALLKQHADQIIDLAKPKVCIELGAGTSAKTEILLSKLCAQPDTTDFTYFSIDVCYEILVEAAERLLTNHKNLIVKSIAGEYVPAIQAVPHDAGPALFVFIGSSIGNFTEQESSVLLAEVSKKMNPEDYFLIGIDRVKEQSILERAYDDSQGVTAKFNLNVLNVLNYKLGANFNLEQFKHQAIYNEQDTQIEMYLTSDCKQEVEISRMKKTLTFSKDEKILTEISRKYTKASIQSLLEKSGLEEVLHFEPSNEYFSLVLAKRKT